MKPTLMILAAGIGSRYGGLKQIDGMGAGDEAILEFSIFDALRAGFGKIVFIIRKDIETEFRARVGSKFEGKIPVEYAFQELDTDLGWLKEKLTRTKPWGTAHAMLAAKKIIKEPFAVINADDYYGPEAFQTLADFLTTKVSKKKMAMVGYRLSNTLSENGSVARGVCHAKRGYLTDVVEHTKIEKKGRVIQNTFEDGSVSKLPAATIVSMNFWGFHPQVFKDIEKMWRPFVEANLENPKAEFFIPLIVNHLVESGEGRCAVLPCEAKWFGVTYTNDKPIVQKAMRDFAKAGIYPVPLAF
jgi:NDP-sugar pyrophosphorylase family protein